ncbi:flippase-like domain-containing protein [Candidatus Pacearchaeota archaeon]|nr:flippase-like domain-containing protein [Candidatus Pacearchaeota archaeon]
MKLKTLISILVLLILVGLLAYYIKNHIFDFKQISLINPLWLIPLIALFLLSYFFMGMQTKVLLKPLGVRLKNLEVYMLSIVTGFYNIITPAHGGMAVRAVYLKKKHNFTYTNFLASLAGMYVLTFFIGSLFGLISLFLIYKIYGFFNWIILLAFLGLFIPLGLIITFSPEFKESKNKFLNNFIKVANGWNIIRKDKKIVWKCLFYTLIMLVISTATQILSYYIFGINLSFIQGLFLATIGSIAILIQLTPGNLGVAEAVAVFSASILGITPAQSLSVAILGRIVQMLVMFTLGPIFSVILLKHKPKRE